MKADETVLAGLRNELVRSARKQDLHPNDVEDVVQEALLKVSREKPRAGAPSLEIRARKALKDKRAEFFRSQARRPSEVPLVSESDENLDRDLPDELVYEEQLYDLVDLAADIRRLFPEDARTFAYLKMLNSTEGDVAALMGWTSKKAAAARMQLNRKRQVARAVLEALSDGEED